MTRSFLPTRRQLAPLAVGLPALGATALGIAGSARAEWKKLPPEQAGYSPSGLAEVEALLVTLPTTALMVVSGGQIAYSYGDIAQPCYLASARKSILSMMFGKYVANGTIDLDQTLGELGIDEADKLLPIEKTAKVRDLLIASSGVYHPAGSPGDDPNTPKRGSHKPGTHFHYNNWDFNVLGAIFEKLVRKPVFKALDDDLAQPLGMQDYDIARQRMMGFEDRSRFLAYHLFLSARDMARLGVVMARDGKWDGKQIVPVEWVRESTKARVAAADVGRAADLAYGYLWWVPVTRTSARWAGSFMMSGQFGQFMLVLPRIDTVIVHRRAVTDEYAVARNLGKTKFEPSRVQAPEFLKIADMIVAAKTA